MRVAITNTIAGLPAELARAIVRKFRGREMVAEIVADLIEGTGFYNDGEAWWGTTRRPASRRPSRYRLIEP